MKSLVYNETVVSRFLNEVLYNPQFGSAFVKGLNLEELPFCLILVARTKYLENKDQYDLKSNTQFHKVIIRHKDKFMKKLYEKNLDMVLDRNGKQLPLECMSAYITLNPRDPRKALFALQKQLIDIAFRQDEREMKRLDIHAFISYHKSPLKISRTVIDFDAEEKNNETEKELLQLLKPIESIIHCIVETRGGYHVYIDLEKSVKSDKIYIFQKLRQMKSDMFKEIQIQTDPMVVIPGTLQGGFYVRFRDDLLK